MHTMSLQYVLHFDYRLSGLDLQIQKPLRICLIKPGALGRHTEIGETDFFVRR